MFVKGQMLSCLPSSVFKCEKLHPLKPPLIYSLLYLYLWCLQSHSRPVIITEERVTACVPKEFHKVKEGMPYGISFSKTSTNRVFFMCQCVKKLVFPKISLTTDSGPSNTNADIFLNNLFPLHLGPSSTQKQHFNTFPSEDFQKPLCIDVYV